MAPCLLVFAATTWSLLIPVHSPESCWSHLPTAGVWLCVWRPPSCSLGAGAGAGGRTAGVGAPLPGLMLLPCAWRLKRRDFWARQATVPLLSRDPHRSILQPDFRWRSRGAGHTLANAVDLTPPAFLRVPVILLLSLSLNLILRFL